jgi:hypothetical protein
VFESRNAAVLQDRQVAGLRHENEVLQEQVNRLRGELGMEPIVFTREKQGKSTAELETPTSQFHTSVMRMAAPMPYQMDPNHHGMHMQVQGLQGMQGMVAVDAHGRVVGGNVVREGETLWIVQDAAGFKQTNEQVPTPPEPGTISALHSDDEDDEEVD